MTPSIRKLYYVAECVEQSHDEIVFASASKSDCEFILNTLEETHKLDIDKNLIGFCMDDFDAAPIVKSLHGATAYFVIGFTHDHHALNPFLYICFDKRKATAEKRRRMNRTAKAEKAYEESKPYDEEDLWCDSYGIQELPLDVLAEDVTDGHMQVYRD